MESRNLWKIPRRHLWLDISSGWFAQFRWDSPIRSICHEHDCNHIVEIIYDRITEPKQNHQSRYIQLDVWHSSRIYEIFNDTIQSADDDFSSRVIKEIYHRLSTYSLAQRSRNAELVIQSSTSATNLPPPPPVASDRPRGAARSHSDGQIGKHLTP